MGWRRVCIEDGYGHTSRRLDIASGTAFGEEPQAFLCTDFKLSPSTSLRWCVYRWRTQATFDNALRHFEVDTQRRWLDPTMLRTTPAPIALVFRVTRWASELAAERRPAIQCVRWFCNALPAFSDALSLGSARILDRTVLRYLGGN